MSGPVLRYLVFRSSSKRWYWSRRSCFTISRRCGCNWSLVPRNRWTKFTKTSRICKSVSYTSGISYSLKYSERVIHNSRLFKISFVWQISMSISDSLLYEYKKYYKFNFLELWKTRVFQRDLANQTSLSWKGIFKHFLCSLEFKNCRKVEIHKILNCVWPAPRILSDSLT